MSPQQQQTLIDTIRAIHRDTYAPARTTAIAQRMYLSDGHMRRYLRALEATGTVRRVGQRGGWLPATA